MVAVRGVVGTKRKERGRESSVDGGLECDEEQIQALPVILASSSPHLQAPESSPFNERRRLGSPPFESRNHVMPDCTTNETAIPRRKAPPTRALMGCTLRPSLRWVPRWWRARTKKESPTHSHCKALAARGATSPLTTCGGPVKGRSTMRGVDEGCRTRRLSIGSETGLRGSLVEGSKKRRTRGRYSATGEGKRFFRPSLKAPHPSPSPL